MVDHRNKHFRLLISTCIVLYPPFLVELLEDEPCSLHDDLVLHLR